MTEPITDDLSEEAADAAEDTLTILSEFDYCPPIQTLIDWAEDRGVDRELIARLEAAAQAISTVAYDTPDAVHDLIEAPW
jgi:malonyl CoA-acyl carrier protein transacylase